MRHNLKFWTPFFSFSPPFMLSPLLPLPPVASPSFLRLLFFSLVSLSMQLRGLGEALWTWVLGRAPAKKYILEHVGTSKIASGDIKFLVFALGKKLNFAEFVNNITNTRYGQLHAMWSIIAKKVKLIFVYLLQWIEKIQHLQWQKMQTSKFLSAVLCEKWGVESWHVFSKMLFFSTSYVRNKCLLHV